MTTTKTRRQSPRRRAEAMRRESAIKLQRTVLNRARELGYLAIRVECSLALGETFVADREVKDGQWDSRALARDFHKLDTEFLSDEEWDQAADAYGDAMRALRTAKMECKVAWRARMLAQGASQKVVDELYPEVEAYHRAKVDAHYKAQKAKAESA